MTTYNVSTVSRTINVTNANTGQIVQSGIDISTVLNSFNNSDLNNWDTVHFVGPATYVSRTTTDATIKIDKSVIITSDVNVAFNNKITANKGSYPLFEFDGYKGNIATLIVDAVQGSNSIRVSNLDIGDGKGNVVPGDLVLVYDNAIWNPVDYPAWKTGELHKISYISGNTITFVDNMINSFSVTNGGSAILIRPITVELNGLTVVGVDYQGDYVGLFLQYCIDSMIHNCNFHDNGWEEVNVINCYNTTIEYNSMSNNIYCGNSPNCPGQHNSGGDGYCIETGLASAYTLIQHNTFGWSRHCVATGGYPYAEGQARETMVQYNVFNNTIATNGIGDGISHTVDCHQSAESFYVYNNVINSPTWEYAITSGSKITKIIGNTINGGQGCCIRGASPYRINYYEITNNAFTDSGYVFQGLPGDNINKLIIQNNIITGDGAIDPWSMKKNQSLTIAYNIQNLTITGNKFDAIIGGTYYNDNTVNHGIYLKSCHGGIITNNCIHNPQKQGMRIVNCGTSSTSFVINNNQLRLWGLGYYGITLESCSNVFATGNILINRNADVNCISQSGKGNSISPNACSKNISNVQNCSSMTRTGNANVSSSTT